MAVNASVKEQSQRSSSASSVAQTQATNASNASAANAQKTQGITLTQSQITYAINYNKKANQSICKKIQNLVGVTADGSFGPITVKAIANWQAKNGLDPDGCFGPKSKAVANLDGKSSSQNNASQGNTSTGNSAQSSAVTLTQSQINYAVSYNKKANQSICKKIQNLVGVTADGSFGPITVKGIAKWQAANGLEADGCFGPASKAAANFDGASQSKPAQDNTGSTKPADQGDTTPIAPDAGDYTGTEKVNYGSSKKTAVKTLQKLLNKHGAKLSVDGSFGKGTAKALMRFQYHYVKEDAGVYFRNTAGAKASCDADTWKVLRQAGPSAKNAPGVAIAFHQGKKLSATPNTSLVTGGVMSANAAAKFNAMVAASRKESDSSKHIKAVTSTFRGMTDEATVAATGGVGGSSGAIELYVDYNFNSARAATPGYSNHCIGNAADISGFGSRTAKPNVWYWLNAHAGTYDFVPYSYETWHWNYKSNS